MLLFNVESEGELLGHRPTWPKACGQVAHVALRVNPDLPPKTHAKTDTSVKGVKFGLDIDTVLEFAQKVVGQPAREDRRPAHASGLADSLGTNRTGQGIEKGLVLIDKLRAQGHPIEYLNMGGGFGIHYRKQEALPAAAFAEVIVPAASGAGLQAVLEPGRFIVGNAGILVSRVIYTKESGGKHFVIQDAAMNDLIRPTLYDSFHRIWPVAPAAGFAGAAGGLRGRHPRHDQEATWSARCASRAISWPRTGRLPPRAPRRPAGDLQRRRLRHGDEFQLQRPAARPRCWSMAAGTA